MNEESQTGSDMISRTLLALAVLPTASNTRTLDAAKSDHTRCESRSGTGSTALHNMTLPRCLSLCRSLLYPSPILLNKELKLNHLRIRYLGLPLRQCQAEDQLDYRSVTLARASEDLG